MSGPSAVAGRAVTTGFSLPGASAARIAKMHMKSWTVIATIEMMPKTQEATRAGLGIELQARQEPQPAKSATARRCSRRPRRRSELFVNDAL